MQLAAALVIILLAMFLLVRKIDVRLVLFGAGLALASLAARPLVVFEVFLAEMGNPYAKIGADSGRMALNWGVYGVPETYVIDGQGKVVLRWAGPITEAVLEKSIRPAIAEAAGN